MPANSWYERNKEVAKARARKWYADNKARARATIDAYRIKNKAAVDARNAAWRAKNPDRVKTIKQKFYATHKAKLLNEVRVYRADFPERYKAVSAVNRALRAGTLVPLPCWVCGKEKTEAHHADYGAPLDVVWLCRKHHQQLHREVNQ